MRVIAIVNQKGGVAKTTSALNIGAGLARAGKKVLLIDLDPQGNLTEGCGVNPDRLDITTYSVVMESLSPRETLTPVIENLDLVPTNRALAAAEVELANIKGQDDKNLRLQVGLKKIRGYDYILVDCPPSLGQLTINALAAAGEVFIPVQPEYYALRGLKSLLDTVEAVREHHNKKLKITGVFVTRFDGRKNLNQGVLDQLQEHFGNRLFATRIRENIALAEAPAAGMTIFDFRGFSHGAEDYRALVVEILAQEAK